jgi:AcrR family transcriptional regulator
MIQNRKRQVGSRQRITDAALTEFAEYGLAGARVDRIARRAKINKAMIYYHFSSKEKLYRSVFRENMQNVAGLVRAQIEQAQGIEEVLLFLADFYNKQIDLESGFGRIMLREIASGGALFRQIFADVITGSGLPGRLTRLIRRGIREGRFREINIRQAVISFIGMNLFYLLMTPVINKVWEIKDGKDFKKGRPTAIVDLFLHGIEEK